MMLGRSVGLTEDELRSMDNTEFCKTFSEADLCVIEYSEQLTMNNIVSDEMYARLDKHFSQEQIVELSMTVGLSAMVNRVHATFKTDVDTDTKSYLASEGLV
jgi:alkylhydroperoxidase family enzyme